MRLLILAKDAPAAESLRQHLYSAAEGWQVEIAADIAQASALLAECRWDGLVAIGAAGAEGIARLEKSPPLCPPRVLAVLGEDDPKPRLADCAVFTGVDGERLAGLCGHMMQKTLPKLAALHEERVAGAAEAFLDELGMDHRWKGRTYLRWCLCRGVPSTCWEDVPMKQLYARCSAAFSTTPAAVERCIRVAVENVFTMGNIRGIEKFFGSSIDPERGKPTNRAFLLHSIRKLRSLLDGGAFREKQ